MKSHIHFMGIGGIGMSFLARWYRSEGYQVSGCDLNESAEVHALRSEGIEVEIGHSPAHLGGVQTLVYSMAVPEDHPEIAGARSQGLTLFRRIELLNKLLEAQPSIAVTGTHGKSTTTGMIAQVFVELGLEPSVFVGGKLPCLGSNIRYGRGERFIAEVDESDPGFARLASDIAVITNLEDDHIAGDFDERRNYHASLADLQQATRQFAHNAGQVVYAADWPGLHELLGDLPETYSYGHSECADYHIGELNLTPTGSRFVFTAPDGSSCQVELKVPGRYNVQNAAAALGAAHLAGQEIGRAAAALAPFRGVGRRWQRKGSVKGALVIDDYAHHPTEIGVTLEAARGTGRRVRAVLQPHRWVRTARHWPAIADAAAEADEILVLDIYGAGEAAIPGISPALIVDRLRSAGKQADHYDPVSAEHYLASSLEPGDLVITLGAGDVWKVGEGLIAACGGDDGSA